MKLDRTFHQIRAIPRGATRRFCNSSIAAVSPYARRNVSAIGSQRRREVYPAKSSKNTARSSACRTTAGLVLSWTISKSIRRARSVALS